MEGFLKPSSTGFFDQVDAAKIRADNNRRAEEANIRAQAQEDDRADLFTIQREQQKDNLDQSKLNNKETNRQSGIAASADASAAMLSRLQTSKLIDPKNAYNLKGDAFRQGIQSGDGAITKLGLEILNMSDTFAEGVEAIGFDVIEGGGIAVRTKNSKGEIGVGSSPADPEANGEVIMLEPGRLGKIANTLYRTSIISGLGADARDRFSAYGAQMDLIDLERQALQKSKEAGGSDMQRDAIAAISEAETDEERLEAAEEVIAVADSITGGATNTETETAPTLSDPYDGPIKLDRLAGLDITSAEFEVMTPEQKQQVAETLTNRRRLSAMGDAATLLPTLAGDAAIAGGRSMLDTDIARTLGLSKPGQEQPENFVDTKEKIESAKSTTAAITVDDLEKGFAALDSDPDYKKAAKQKQLDRFNKMDELTPTQQKRKEALEQEISGTPDAATVKPSAVTTASGAVSNQLEGKSGNEINAGIADGSITATQEEGVAVAKALKSSGIETIEDLYQADITDIERMTALAFMRLFNTNPTIDNRLEGEIRNLGETGKRSVNTTQASTIESQYNSAANSARSSNVAAFNANLNYQKFIDGLRKDDDANVIQAVDDVDTAMSAVFNSAYGENGAEFVGNAATARTIMRRIIGPLDIKATTAKNDKAKLVYEEAKNQALSLAIQSLANEGGTGFDYFTAMFRENVSGAARKTLDNITTDGVNIFYQEPDSMGEMKNVGAGIPVSTLTKANQELALEIFKIAKENTAEAQN